MISIILYIYCYICKITIVLIREDRFGHQIGTLDSELFLATERKEKFKRDTVFLLIEKTDNIANKYLRQISPGIIKDLGFRPKVLKSKSKYTIFQLFFKNYISENKRFYRSSKVLTPHLKQSLFNDNNTSENILNKLGISLVVVHGGGPRIKRELDKSNI